MSFDKTLTDSNLIRSNFLSLKSRTDIAKILEVSEQGLRHLLYGIPPKLKYQIFTIPKKSGGERTIASPNEQLKGLQRKLLKILETVFKPKICAHGFILSRNICSNAKRHVGCKYILNVDIADFFPTIHFGRVCGMFMAYPYNLPQDVAVVLAQICCFEGYLPQGAPTSPIISNMLCAKLDSQLMKLAGKYRCIYTRYADDLTFSTNQKEFPKDLAFINQSSKTEIGNELHKVIKKNGFNINTQKLRLQLKFERQEVTGLVVNKKLNTNRKYIREIRALLHNWEKHGLKECEKTYLRKYASLRPHKNNDSFLFEQMVQGKINFLRMVRGIDDNIYLNFIHKLAKLAPHLVNSQTKAYLERIHNNADWILSKLLFIEAEGIDGSLNEGTGFFLENYGLVTCAHIFGEKTEIPVDSSWKITVSNRDGSIKANAKILKLDYDLDLAILTSDFEPRHYFHMDDKQQLFIDKTEIKLAGFPNHSFTNSGRVASGKIISKKIFFKNEFYVISVNILTGNSGGPIFNLNDKVIGIAARGSANDADGYETEFHGFIPVNRINDL